ncbi:hypothetical protein MKX03_003348, partial [Papaver bracteatum]
ENLAENVPEIWDTMGLSFIFEVQLNAKSFGYNSFSVRKLYPIIFELEEKFKLGNIQQ